MLRAFSRWNKQTARIFNSEFIDSALCTGCFNFNIDNYGMGIDSKKLVFCQIKLYTAVGVALIITVWCVLHVCYIMSLDSCMVLRSPRNIAKINRKHSSTYSLPNKCNIMLYFHQDLIFVLNTRTLYIMLIQTVCQGCLLQLKLLLNMM